MDGWKRLVPVNGHRNAVVHVSGLVGGPWSRDLVGVEELDSPKSLRIETLVYSFESGLACWLEWQLASGEVELILPLEGRGKLEFEMLQGLQSPEGLVGIQMTTLLSAPSTRGFFLALDLTKQ